MATSRALVSTEVASFAGDHHAAATRTKGVSRARRHTRLVRTLRVALPATTVLLLGGYAFVVFQTSGGLAGLPAAALKRILPENLRMENPHYDGYGKDGSSYVVDAKSAQQDLATPNLIKLDTITATLTQPDKTRTFVTAHSGQFDHKANVLELYRSIDVNSESGMKAKLTQATLMTKDNVLISKDPVLVEYPTGTIRSQTLTFRQKTREAEFVDKVVARLKPQPPQEKGLAPLAGTAAAAAKPAEPASLFQSSGEPIDITADRLDVKDAQKLAIFRGRVKAVQAEGTMTTPELSVSYATEDATDPTSPAKPASADAALASGKVKRITAAGPVVMTQGPTQRVQAENAEFDAVNERAVLSGNVVMTAGTDRSAVSDRADLDQRANTALLTGEVVVQQGPNILKGRRFFINRGAGTAQLTSPPAQGAGPGRITAHFVQEGKREDKKEASAAKPAQGAAAAGAGGFGSFKTDPNAPIDIEADALDVHDGQHTATFRGDVNAVQGGFVIRTSELVATYTGDTKLADVTADSSPGQKPDGPASALTKVEAKKNVVVTSSDGQMARGDWAVYDAKVNTVTLGGEVTLSNGENMVRGTRLIIDMVSGRSTIDSDPAAANAQAGSGGWSTTASQAGEAGNRGRPSAIIFPKALRDAGQLKKGAEKTKPAASGWTSETAPEAASP